MDYDCDYLIVGSGFGGSVSALRLVEKGYSTVVLEKGRRFARRDFPKSNWDLRRWMWLPKAGMRGLFKMTFLPHVTVLSGVGVGGGSLVYANTLPTPKDGFFRSPSWAHLADWKAELAPHYATAIRMLGATEFPHTTYSDRIVQEVARDIGRPDGVHPSRVGVYFGKPGITVPDPFFDGKGPARTGCTLCGGCMLGCRHGAKNTLEQNYLYLAERQGLRIQPNTEVTWIRPLAGGGFEVRAFRRGRGHQRYRTRNLVMSGGVMGTVDLLLRLREHEHGLPRLSARLGHTVRTNSESLIGVTTRRRDVDMSEGIAITSILHTDEHSHLEPVRYPHGSGFFRFAMAPHVGPGSRLSRILQAAGAVARHPLQMLRTALVPDWARYTMILLYMRSLDGHLRIKRGRSLYTGFRRGMTTELSEGPAPQASIPEATELAHRIAEKVDGQATSMLQETILGTPSTAHILGGCCMGEDAESGVIDPEHRAFGYDGLYVIDGSAVSANPGVNPSLTITALAERAMDLIPVKG